MIRYVLARVLWMVPMLFGITLLTFAVLDLSPVDRAEAAVGRAMQDADTRQRAEAVRRMRAHIGMVDEDGNTRSVWERYLAWVSHAARFDFSSRGEDPVAFRARYGRALSVSVLLGLAAVTLALVGGVALGAWSGLRAGGALDRLVSGVSVVAYALPEFLIASLLLLLLGGGLWEALLPSSGLRDVESAGWSTGERFVDLLLHLVMPVTTLALAPFAIVLRYVRDATARALGSDFVRSMRAWGASDAAIRRVAVRHGLVPVATLIGPLLPIVVAGSVVVEQAFALPGVGRLTFDGVLSKDAGVVMATTLMVSVATLVSLLLSDLAHRAIDPRVRLR